MDFSIVTNRILDTIEAWVPKLTELSVEILTEKRNVQNRTIKQIVGHLIDSASNNHQRMVRLQYNAQLNFPDYQQDNDLWIAIQNYQQADLTSLIQLWKFYNLHIVQVIRSVDETKLENTWHNFEGEPVTLRQMIEGYMGHLDLHFAEIQELIDA